MEGLAGALAATALAGIGGTGLGGLASCLVRRDADRAVAVLLSFAAGVMTSVVCFDLLADAVGPEGRPLLASAGVLAGFAATGALNGLIGRAPSGRGRRGLFLAGVVMAAAIALHNVPEGMVIGASCARASLTSGRGALAAAVVIGLHNVPEGMAVAVPLIAGGMGKGRAAAVTALAGAPTVLGALIGWALGTLGPTSLLLSLSFASGAMLYVVFGELLPESARLGSQDRQALAAVLGFIVGMAVVCG